MRNTWQMLETRPTATQAAAPEDLDPRFQFVWSLRYIDAAVLRDENRDGDSSCTDEDDQRLYYLNDANMNVTALASASGDVAERYEYDPYGRVSVLDPDWTAEADSLSDFDNEILYCGYVYDTETGFYCVRNRHLAPTLGRWLQRDPMKYVDGMNLYEYVQSSPCCRNDAKGLRTPTPEDIDASIDVLDKLGPNAAASYFDAVTAAGASESICHVGRGGGARFYPCGQGPDFIDPGRYNDPERNKSYFYRARERDVCEAHKCSETYASCTLKVSRDFALCIGIPSLIGGLNEAGIFMVCAKVKAAGPGPYAACLAVLSGANLTVFWINYERCSAKEKIQTDRCEGAYRHCLKAVR